jgi:hypothetical protein
MCFGIDRSTEPAPRAGAGVGAEEGSGSGKGRRGRVARRRQCACGLPAEKLDELAAGVRTLRQAMLAERRSEIDRLVAEAAARGEDAERAYWTMVYDHEMAPPATSRALLLEHRIVPVPPQDLVAAEDLHDELWTVIEGLAASGVFLLNSDHLPDRDLYCRLYYRILDEPARLMPPESEAAEFIDCLHPMDLEVGRAAHALVARNQAEAPQKRPPTGARGPVCTVALADRDRWLPVPAWG